MSTKMYFDNAATTPVREEVLQEILPYFVSHNCYIIAYIHLSNLQVVISYLVQDMPSYHLGLLYLPR